MTKRKAKKTVLDGIDLEGLDTQALNNAFREETIQELDKCTPVANPAVYRFLQTREGYLQIEEKIIDLCLHNQITPSAAIGLLESELSDN